MSAFWWVIAGYVMGASGVLVNVWLKFKQGEWKRGDR